MLSFVRPALPTAKTSRNPQAAAFDGLSAVRQWLNAFEIRDPSVAHLICRVVPAQCPFERTIRLSDRLCFHTPPLCKLNPLYEEVVSLRFRALCYLENVGDCDVRRYC